MKAEVLKKFKDKYTGEIYMPGDIITVTKKRFKEILEVDVLVAEVNEKNDEA